MILQAVAYQKDAPGTTPVQADAVSGDNLTLATPPEGAGIYLLDWCFASEGAAGEHRLIWPTGHDTSYGLGIIADTSQRRLYALPEIRPQFRPAETIRPYVAGSGTSGQAAYGVLAIYYEQLQGAEGMMIGYDEFQRVRKQSLGWTQQLSISGKLAWTTHGALDNSRDVWKRNSRYAIIGAKADTSIVALAIRGPDTGNVRCPILFQNNDRVLSARYFLDLANRSGLPVIPVIQGANVGATLLEFLANTASGTANVTLFAVEVE